MNYDIPMDRYYTPVGAVPFWSGPAVRRASDRLWLVLLAGLIDASSLFFVTIPLLPFCVWIAP
jgi:hypothetical protein